MQLVFCHSYGVNYSYTHQENDLTTAPSFDGTQVCVKLDPEVFFPELPEKPTAQDKVDFKLAVFSAKQKCGVCLFVDPCLEYALQNDVWGVWGATTERERSAIRRERKIPTPRSMTLFTNAWVNQKGAR
jgi:hypothetical protein